MMRERKHRYPPVVVAGLIALALGGLSATSALGSTWTGRQLTGEASKVMMFGISCPTMSLCVAVGGNNSIASSTNPAGGQESWGTVYAGSGAVIIPEGGGFYNGGQVRGVSCPSPQLCVAVTFDGLIYTSTNPTGAADAWAVTDVDGSGPNTHFYGVSCPTVSFCAAAAGGGRIATTTNPTGGIAAWTITQLEGPLELRGVSCLSATLCVAVGDDGDHIAPQPTDNGQVLSSTDPLGGAWQRVSMLGAQGSLYGASCPSPALCVSGNLLGNLVVTTSPTGPAAAWETIDGGGAVQITDTDCPSPTRCVAIDNNADVLTSTNPTGGASDWTFTNVLPYPFVDETAFNGTFGVSCPSVSFCAIAGAKGQILTSNDPFVVAPTPVKGTGRGTGKKMKRPKRPRVTIARAPYSGLEIDPGTKAPVRVFFFARKHVQVRGFACKLDGHPVRRCRSPKSYRVGVGRHVFHVRAIGWTGLKGPPEVARFRVCHPTPYPNCMRHLPPPNVRHRPGRDGSSVPRVPRLSLRRCRPRSVRSGRRPSMPVCVEGSYRRFGAWMWISAPT
jgi:hypothetical protein